MAGKTSDLRLYLRARRIILSCTYVSKYIHTYTIVRKQKIGYYSTNYLTDRFEFIKISERKKTIEMGS